MDSRVGFIGLGDIGTPMSLCLARAGFHLSVYDIRPERIVELVAAGAGSAASPLAVAKACDVLVIMVLNARQVEQVLSGKEGALGGLKPGKIVVVMCTISPADTQRFADLVRSTGARYLDAPVSGGVVRAAKGDLTVMVGGPDDVLERCRPILAAMGSSIYHVGPEIGSGQAVKMVNSILCSIHTVAAAEAMTMGVKLGVDPEVIYEVITHSVGDSVIFRNNMRAVIARDFMCNKAALRTQHKDLGIAVTAASEAQVPLLLTSVVYQLHQKAMADGLGGEDNTAVMKVVESLAGVQIKRN